MYLRNLASSAQLIVKEKDKSFADFLPEEEHAKFFEFCKSVANFADILFLSKSKFSRCLHNSVIV